MEESVVARFEHGPLRSLFTKNCFLTNRPGSGNNWAVGHYEHGSEQRESIIEIVRKAAECCDYLHGFLMVFSLAGGTGSGLGSSILPILKEEFPGVDRLVSCVHPGAYNDVITSPYNVAFTLRRLTEDASCVFPVDNKALNDVCEHHKTIIDPNSTVPYKDVNNLIVKKLLNLTSGCRFPGPLNLDLNELATNMTPFEGLHYLTSSFYPLNPNPIILNDNELITSVLSRRNQLLRFYPFSSYILSATLLCRGDLSLTNCRDYVKRFSRKALHPVWNPNGVKTGLCSVPNFDSTKSLLCLTNTIAMSGLFKETLHYFKRLYRKKAHVHHYSKVDGFEEEEEFYLAAESLLETITKYNAAGETVEVPRLEVT